MSFHSVWQKFNLLRLVSSLFPSAHGIAISIRQMMMDQKRDFFEEKILSLQLYFYSEDLEVHNTPIYYK